MISNVTSGYLEKSARVISVIFHPLLIPVYGTIIIFAAPTLYTYIPFTVKKLVTLIVLVNNVLLPLSLIPFFIHSNMISSWSVTEIKDRKAPLILSTLLYAVTAYIIFRFPVPQFLKTFIIASFFISLIVTLINLRWKISLHSVGAGVLVAVVLILSLKMSTPLLEYIIPSIIAGSLVLSARLMLGLHEPKQVWFGFLTGFLGLSLTMILF
jgi:hypothetical protein